MTTAVVYGKPNCIWCDRAKAVLKGMGVELEYRDVSDPAVLAELKEQLPAVRSVPQIWLASNYVGGHDDLIELLESSAAAKPTPAEWNPDADFGQAQF